MFVFVVWPSVGSLIRSYTYILYFFLDLSHNCVLDSWGVVSFQCCCAVFLSQFGFPLGPTGSFGFLPVLSRRKSQVSSLDILLLRGLSLALSLLTFVLCLFSSPVLWGLPCFSVLLPSWAFALLPFSSSFLPSLRFLCAWRGTCSPLVQRDYGFGSLAFWVLRLLDEMVLC